MLWPEPDVLERVNVTEVALAVAMTGLPPTAISSCARQTGGAVHTVAKVNTIEDPIPLPPVVIRSEPSFLLKIAALPAPLVMTGTAPPAPKCTAWEQKGVAKLLFAHLTDASCEGSS